MGNFLIPPNLVHPRGIAAIDRLPLAERLRSPIRSIDRMRGELQVLPNAQIRLTTTTAPSANSATPAGT